jgi:hypothetical protein
MASSQGTKGKLERDHGKKYNTMTPYHLPIPEHGLQVFHGRSVSLEVVGPDA